MHPFVSINDRVVGLDKAKLPLTSSAILTGRGVLATVAIYDGEPFLWREHWSQLIDQAMRIGLDPSGVDESRALGSLTRLVYANKAGTGVADLALLGNREGATSSGNPAIIIATRELSVPGRDVVTITVSPYRVNTMSPLTGIRSAACLEQLLALEEARSRDFDEAIMVNERGEITAATFANIFWVTDGTIHTPAIATGAFAGITRGRVIELAGEMSFPLVEGAYDMSSLSEAHEIFITSAARGLAIVNTYDFRHYSVPIGSVGLRLLEAFRQLTMRRE